MSHVLRAALAPVLLASCVSVSAISNPTPPAPGWKVYSSAESGLAITLPPGWNAFALPAQFDDAAQAWTSGMPEVLSGARGVLQSIVDKGAGRFIAVDTNPPSGTRRSAAFAVRTAAPAGDLESAVRGAAQTPGRSLSPTVEYCPSAGG